MNVDEQTIAEFEQSGVDSVRLRLQSGLIGASQIQPALDWLREKDAAALAEQARCDQTETSNAKFTRVMLIATTISAILTLIVSLLDRCSPPH